MQSAYAHEYPMVSQKRALDSGATLCDTYTRLDKKIPENVTMDLIEYTKSFGGNILCKYVVCIILQFQSNTLNAVVAFADVSPESYL